MPVLKDDIIALDLTDAVAPVKMIVGGCVGLSLTADSSKGSAAWLKK